MNDQYLNLHNAVILEKSSNFYSYKIRTIIRKNVKKKPKNKSKKIDLKIINGFLVYRFITSYLCKLRKIVNYQQNIAPANYATKRPNESNLVYSNHSIRCKTKYKLQISTNLFQSIKLVGLTGLTILFYIINLYQSIPPALYFIKYKIVGKIFILIICLFKNKSYFIQKRVLSYLSISFNKKKMLIFNLVLTASLFNYFFLYKTQILQS